MNREKRTSDYDAHRALVAAKAARADKLARDNSSRDYFTRDTRKVQP